MKINNLIEMHSHILPGIDDGAKDVQTSLKMIERLKEQGAETIVLTSHFYSDTMSLEDFLAKRDNAMAELTAVLPDGSPRLISAAEVYISDYLFNYDSLDKLKIGNSDYVLIEHPFSSEFSQKDYNRLSNLYCDYGVKPILAHIERYKALMDNPKKIDGLLDLGCLTQVNISSFFDEHHSTKKKLFKLLKAGRISLLCSDCHNMTSRPPEYSDGISAITKKCGDEIITELMNRAKRITD